ncbi:MAG: 1-deoxy-D-xylulose-5-phosphate reductoisomerase [Candidatus Delongbacteria bacterium]
MPNRDGILLLGSTGSIGESTLDVIRQHPERFRVVGLSAGQRWERLAEQARDFRPDFVHVDEAHAGLLRQALAETGIEVLSGRAALVELPERPGVDTLFSALLGTAGLEPLMRGLRAGRRICFANKEPLVTAGQAVMREVRALGAVFLPVDSEHSAILQCLQGEQPEDLERIWLTASGGPFRGWSRERFRAATREEALRHPTWTMGAKITIDSATMMNKALEIIEAAWLYDLPEERIGVLIHPQSIIHSMVEFRDHSVKAQLGLPDMRIPILYALCWPRHERLEMASPDWTRLGRLEFEEPDLATFRSLGLAREALRLGEGWPCVLNAANEVAVELFLEDGLAFGQIVDLVEESLAAYSGGHSGLDELIDLDAETRRRTRTLARTLAQARNTTCC